MDATCEICGFLQNPKHPMLLTDYWRVDLGNNHAYLGCAYIQTRTHKGSLHELTDEEWQDFREIVRKLEPAYKAAFGAEPLNWAYFTNDAFRNDPPNPHVHWHLFPRYKKAPELNGSSYGDPLYGNPGDNTAVRLVDDAIVAQIAAKLKAFL